MVSRIDDTEKGEKMNWLQAYRKAVERILPKSWVESEKRFVKKESYKDYLLMK